MKRIALMLAGVVGLVGCDDGGGWKATCSATQPCPEGNYCATTADGSVCWPDGVGPTVTVEPTATCNGGATCKRTDTLHVSVGVTDDQKVGTVEAALDLDSARHVALTNGGSGSTYAADIALTDFPVDFYARGVTVTITAKDDAGNLAAGTHAASVTVTREAWKRQLATAASFQLWSPAVLSDGRVAVAGENGNLYLVSKAGNSSTTVSVSSNKLNGPASVGSTAIWVGSEDGKLYPVSTSGTVGTACNGNAGMLGAPAITGTKAVSATKSSRVVVADAAGTCVPALVSSPGQPVGVGTKLFVPGGGTLQSYTVLADGVLSPDWTGTPAPPTIGTVTVPPAVDASGAIWTSSLAGLLYRTSASGVATQVSPTVPVSENSTGAIVLSDGSAVLGDYGAETVRRLTANGNSSWATIPTVNGHAAIPLALAGETPSLLVTTDTGYVYAFRQSDGASLWSGRVTVDDKALQPPNIWTEPGAAISTAYLAGADGYLYAVIVDGTLDTSAPWPKAYHDPQNTSHAGGTP